MSSHADEPPGTGPPSGVGGVAVMDMNELGSVAEGLVAPAKGLLAADESLPTLKKRFDSVGIEFTEENRRAYRELLFTTPGIDQFISGVIMFDETIRQKTKDGVPFPEVLAERGIIPGIKVDQHTEDLPLFPGEKVTHGLDGLRERLKEYRGLGARFAKWRAVIAIGDGIPTRHCIKANAYVMALYAALCQDSGLMPICEPEVLMDGDHTVERCEEVTEQALAEAFHVLHEQRVRFEGILLKPNMVLPGKDSRQQVSVQEAAAITVDCMRRVVPAAVPGIVFLSGGQDAILGTRHLNAMNEIDDVPWELSFSFARALQDPVMRAWKGLPENTTSAQEIFHHRAECNSLARSGRYREEMDREK